MDMPFGQPRLQGLLPRPQRLNDLVWGKYVAYQGQRPGSRAHFVVIYVKEPGKTQVVEKHDIPESGIRHEDPVNSDSPSEGVWFLLAGPHGVPTYAEKLADIRADMLQRMSEGQKRVEAAEAKVKLTDKLQLQTDEERTKHLAEIHKNLTDASAKDMGFMAPRRRPDQGGSS